MKLEKAIVFSVSKLLRKFKFRSISAADKAEFFNVMSWQSK